MTPDNGDWYRAAYAVAITVYVLYTVLLWRRRARVRDELRRIQGDRT
jgi:hypothetical protein